MLKGLSALEIGRLRMSVGYGTHKRGRPLSPVEVGKLLRLTKEAGSTFEDCAKDLGLKGTTWLNHFLAVYGLAADLRHLVAWGRSSGSIGFTAAVELARIPETDDQRAVARAILEEGLQTDEVRQVAQIRKRSGRPIADCLQEVIGMRPSIDKRYVFIGAVDDQRVIDSLAKLTQAERNALLGAAIAQLGLRGASARLGEKLFTLVGDERFNASIASQGKDKIEARIRAQIGEKVAHVHSES